MGLIQTPYKSIQYLYLSRYQKFYIEEFKYECKYIKQTRKKHEIYLT